MSTTTRNAPEVNLLKTVIARLKFGGFDVYQEVQFESRRIDVVADDEKTLVCISGKMALTDEVIAQAQELAGVCDASCVAVPMLVRHSDAFEARRAELERLGLGLILVDRGRVTEPIKARRAVGAQPWRVRDALVPQQQDFAPAGSQSEMWTAERQWIDAIADEINACGRVRLIDCEKLQANSPDRVKKGAVPKAIERLAHAGKLPFARIETSGGQSWLVKH